jgi:hypothetical protein
MTISVRINQELRANLRRASALEGITVTEFVRRAIIEGVEARRKSRKPEQNREKAPVKQRQTR